MPVVRTTPTLRRSVNQTDHLRRRCADRCSDPAGERHLSNPLTTTLTSAVDSFPAPAPAPGTATALTTFNDTSANGTWSLWVVDDTLGDPGSISGGWCLTITSQAPTTTAVTASPNPSTFGQTVTLRATVTSGGAPVTTGTVQFQDGATDLAPPVDVDADGVATLPESALAVGPHSITATYSGTASLAESVGTVTQVVEPSCFRDSAHVVAQSVECRRSGDLHRDGPRRG